MKKTKILFFLLSFSVLFGNPLSADGLSQEEFQARLLPGSGAAAGQARKLIIVVESYTTADEVKQLIQIFHNSGYDQFRSALKGVKKGEARPTGGRGVKINLNAAQSLPTEKGRKVILVGNSQSWSLDTSYRYDGRFPFLFIELDLNQKGKGSGKIYVQADITLSSDGTIELASYGSPPKQLFGVGVKK
jgi:hypothetical protein